jgi:PGF-CTERM protein
MKIVHLILMACLLAMISTTSAQDQTSTATGSIQDQINTAGQQLQEKAVQHILEGNLTQEHIAQDLNATRENLTEQARTKINEAELKKRVSQEIQKQPGFEAAIAILATLTAVGLFRRRN